MISSKNMDRLYAFGRVFSGCGNTGQKVRILGPDYTPYSQTDLKIAPIQRTFLIINTFYDILPYVPCGNLLYLVGLEKYIKKQATITNDEDAFCIRSMKFSQSPVVRISVEP